MKRLNSRFTVKKYDNTYKLSKEQMNEVMEILRLSPSSVNLQPWNFKILQSDESKKKLADCTVDYNFNTNRILNSSCAIVFGSLKDAGSSHIKKVVNKEKEDGRLQTEDEYNSSINSKSYFVNLHKNEFNDEREWHEKQTYLSVGFVVSQTSKLGIESTIMEGADFDKVAEVFDFGDYKPTLILCLGKETSEDRNKTLPKSRLPKEELIEVL